MSELSQQYLDESFERFAKRRSDTQQEFDAELAALNTCCTKLAPLSDEARARVMLYLARRYGGVVLPTLRDEPDEDSE